MEELFRKEVRDAQLNRLHGEVLLLPRLSYTLILFFLVAWVAVCLVWAFNSTYARKVRVLGWVESASGVANVYSATDGVVGEILVKEGDAVMEGQPLLTINRDVMLTDGVRMETLLATELSSQKTILQDQLVQTERAYELRQQDIAQQIQSAKDDLVGLEKKLETAETRYRLAEAQLKNMATLQAAGFVSKVELDAAKQQNLILLSDKQSLIREKTQNQSHLRQLEGQKELLPVDLLGTLSELNSRLSSNTQETARLSGQHSQVIFASKTGTVTNVQVRLGQVAIAGKPLLSLLPENAALHVQLLVPVRSIGFVQVGQGLDIRYDAFPYEKFGLYPGKITDVSQTVLLPGELIGSPLAVNEPVYRIEAYLDHLYVNAYGKKLPLKAGMTLSADVKLENRTLVEWLLEPIYSLKGSL